ncbi:uncharacterized protein LOC109708859 [Ananas comosus]|uniref:Uncharacterized protein LOC109708859 n=1 Tax=Ananas comosus TaxID=4615 RepID=A0A6P5ES43_ANACO|nr:uncharacterized protein LOC109708859 [Ananas comosus]XP_020086330.1 uncharacterized protein LOC109708859 [Ananas comosus]XP_020086332.1 uncharacterized protein LOC109708859 [Ananas comosus]XP_020086333.1 uncharacterized protein LOC109708859 [Ananas comosus]
MYPSAPCASAISKISPILPPPAATAGSHCYALLRRSRVRPKAQSDGADASALRESAEKAGEEGEATGRRPSSPAPLPPPPPPLPQVMSPKIEKDLKKVVQKTAATFAPRASTATKNPAVPGTTLYTVFEVQGYLSMLLGGALSFNLIFPSSEPDIWRLMGMWSIWMFTIPSLRARDCSKNEKEALNYLFLLIPLLNVLIPLFWKSFAVVWSADVVAFFVMYTWKLGWLQRSD